MLITRGDIKKIKFQRRKEGQPILEKADKIYFTVKETHYKKEVVIQKTIDDMEFDEQGYYHLIITPEDTNELKYGEYVFDIEVIVEEYKKTLIKGTFKIEEEVTFAENEV